jgi:hypothetical protein
MFLSNSCNALLKKRAARSGSDTPIQRFLQAIGVPDVSEKLAHPQTWHTFLLFFCNVALRRLRRTHTGREPFRWGHMPNVSPRGFFFDGPDPVQNTLQPFLSSFSSSDPNPPVGF